MLKTMFTAVVRPESSDLEVVSVDLDRGIACEIDVAEAIGRCVGILEPGSVELKLGEIIENQVDRQILYGLWRMATDLNRFKLDVLEISQIFEKLT